MIERLFLMAFIFIIVLVLNIVCAAFDEVAFPNFSVVYFLVNAFVISLLMCAVLVYEGCI